MHRYAYSGFMRASMTLFPGPVPDELGRLTMLEWVFLSVKRLEGRLLEVELKPGIFPK